MPRSPVLRPPPTYPLPPSLSLGASVPPVCYLDSFCSLTLADTAIVAAQFGPAARLSSRIWGLVGPRSEGMLIPLVIFLAATHMIV
jgi:hypothetical protein